jgi:hypothetical protein
MEAILIAPKNEKEKAALNDFLNSSGISSFKISDKTKRYLARLEMIEIAAQHPKFEISDEEIINMLKESEEQVYGKYRKESGD